jgi:hypothetical protein
MVNILAWLVVVAVVLIPVACPLHSCENDEVKRFRQCKMWSLQILKLAFWKEIAVLHVMQHWLIQD